MRKTVVGFLIAIMLTGSLTIADAAIVKNGAPCTQVGAKKLLMLKHLNAHKLARKRLGSSLRHHECLQRQLKHQLKHQPKRLL